MFGGSAAYLQVICIFLYIPHCSMYHIHHHTLERSPSVKLPPIRRKCSNNNRTTKTYGDFCAAGNVPDIRYILL